MTLRIMMWHYDTSKPSESSDFGCHLYRWMECNNLFQVINEPTRITQHGATLLDIIITNCPGCFVYSGTQSLPANCDHSLIFAKISITLSKQKCYKRLIWDFNNVNAIELCDALASADLDSQLSNSNDINTIYQNWYARFRKVIETHIPINDLLKSACQCS